MTNEDPSYETVLRDLYAGLAMVAILPNFTGTPDDLADRCFGYADELLAARKGEEPTAFSDEWTPGDGPIG